MAWWNPSTWFSSVSLGSVTATDENKIFGIPKTYVYIGIVVILAIVGLFLFRKMKMGGS